MAAAIPLPAADFFVSPNGSDSAAGTAAAPFATLTKARDAIRTLKASSGLPPEGVTVWLRGGFYDLASTLTLDSNDSGTASAPIVYSAYPGEEARLTGARRLDAAWFSTVTSASPVWSRIDPAARGELLVANLPAHGIANYGTLKERGYYNHQIAPLTFFWDGRPLTLARWPNDTRTFAFTKSALSTTRFTYTGDRPSRWTLAEEPWLHGLWSYHWADFHTKIATIDTASRTIDMASEPGDFGILDDRPYYAYNLLEEIDQPGEYYLDRTTGNLYLWPPAPISAATLQVSMLETPLLQISGAQHLLFRELVFEAGRDRLVRISSGASNRFERCLFRNAAYAAYIAGTANGLDHCEIVDCDEEGIRLAGGNRATLAPGGNFVTNSRIHRVAREAWTYHPAVYIEKSCGQIVAHNLIDDLPHSAVIFWGNEHRIEHNEIRRVCQLTVDCGAIYTGRDLGFRGNLIRGNFIHHVAPPWPLSGAHGVYLDDMVSGPAVTGNVFYGIRNSGIFCGGGRDLDLSNNLFVACDNAHFNADYVRTEVNNTPGDSFNFLERLADNGIHYQQEPWLSRYPACAAIPNDFATFMEGLWRSPEGCRFDRNAGWANDGWMVEGDLYGYGIFELYASIANNNAAHVALFDERATIDRARRPATLAAAVSGFAPIAFAAIGRDFTGWPAATLPPPTPTLTCRAVSPTEVALEWTDDGNLTANQETGFTIERRNLPDGPWQTWRTYGADATFDRHTGLAPGTDYAFRIRASNAAGSVVSPAVSLTTASVLVPSGMATRLEAETGFIVVADVGTFGTVGASSPTAANLDSGSSVRLYDAGDAIRLSFTTATAGLYRLGLRVRTGSTSNPTIFWPAGYRFQLDNTPLTLTGDDSTLSAVDPGYGGCTWGTMYSVPLSLAAGAHTVSVTAASNWAVADYLEVVAMVPPVPTTFAAWCSAHFSSDQIALPSLSGPLASPAGDETANLLKYALGLDPWTARRTPVETVTLAAGRLQLDYTRPIGRTDVNYTIEASADLLTWTPLSSSVVATDGHSETLRAQRTLAAVLFDH
ncbi:MAG TPA: right-handed parallel beta-helix repeat-containing protein, partial [Opitutaceae bacterium]|nr:right-handed parallel beta-helix repeat-containing protein [Opitutaceae bacterium]